MTTQAVKTVVIVCSVAAVGIASPFSASHADVSGEKTQAASISIHVSGNRSFYWEGRKLRYLVVTEDPGLGDSLHGTLPVEHTSVRFGYMKADGPTPSSFANAEGDSANVSQGRALIQREDCLLCHTIQGADVVPNFATIGRTAHDSKDARTRMADKIAKGSPTSLGGIQMPPHTGLSEAQILAIVDFISSLHDEHENPRTVLPSGEIQIGDLQPAKSRQDSRSRIIILAASYNRGDFSPNAKPFAAAEIRLRSPLLAASEAAGSHGFDSTPDGDPRRIARSRHAGAYLEFGGIDLTGVSVIDVILAQDEGHRLTNHGRIVLRADGVGGRRLGAGKIDAATTMQWAGGTPTSMKGQQHPARSNRLPIAIDPIQGFHRLYLVLEAADGTTPEAAIAGFEVHANSVDSYE